MKKIILAVLVSLMLPSFSFAQLADIDPTGMSSSCIVLNNNMNYRTRDISTNNEVSMLQDFLNSEGYLSVEPTGYFGLQTVAAAKKFQSASGFSPTGYVGPLTRGKIKEMTCGDTSTTTSSPAPITVTTNYSNLPAGCTSDRGYSSTTGKRCLVTVEPAVNYSSYPAGCFSASGYSSVNGNRCDGSVPAKPVYMSGCTSTSGWSSTTGKACDGSTKQNPAYPAGCLSASGFSSVDGSNCSGNVTPVISEISSKGGSAGELYVGTTGYIIGKGLKGSVTISVGGKVSYVNSSSDTLVTFLVPAFPMYPAEGVDVVVANSSAKSNVYKVTIKSLYPSGCISTSGWSSTTGNACDGSTPAQPVYPSGCLSSSGWSSTTGKACDGSTKQNPAYPVGCTSNSGFSSIDGSSCSAVVTTTITTPSTFRAGCTSTSGWSSVDGSSCANTQ